MGEKNSIVNDDGGDGVGRRGNRVWIMTPKSVLSVFNPLGGVIYCMNGTYILP